MAIQIEDFISYVDGISLENSEDIKGIKNIVEIFSELLKKNDITDEKMMFLAKSVFDKIKDEKEIFDDEYLSLMVGTFVGYVLGKYSKKLVIKDFKL